jgi:hypothetical protein
MALLPVKVQFVTLNAASVTLRIAPPMPLPAFAMAWLPVNVPPSSANR